MTTIFETLARDLVTNWTGDMDGASFLVEPMTQALVKGINKMLERPEVKRINLTDARLREVFAMPSDAPVERVSERIMQLIHKAAPIEARSISIAFASQRPPQAVLPTPQLEPEPTLQMLLAQAQGMPNLAPVIKPMTVAVQATDRAFKGYGNSYVRDLIERGLRDVARHLKALPIINAELPGFSRRYALALALERAALSVQRFIAPSSLELGAYVHQTLQQAYLRYYQKPPFFDQEIVIERTLYRDTLPPLKLGEALIGGISRGHLDYLILDQALLSPFTKRGRLRTDLTHLSPARQIWEIKPMTQASKGVIQEAYYRVMYNILAQDYGSTLPAGSLLRVRTKVMIGGGDWPADTLRNIPLTAQMSVPGLAMPFWISELPGLILYIVVKAELTEREFSIIAVTLTSALLAALKRLIDESKKLGNQIAEALEKFAKELERGVRILLEQFGHWLAVIALVIAAIVLALTAPAWLPAFALGALVLFFVTSNDEMGGKAKGNEQATRQQGTLNFSFVSLANFPVERLPKFALLVNSLFNEALQTTTIAFSEAVGGIPQV